MTTSAQQRAANAAPQPVEVPISKQSTLPKKLLQSEDGTMTDEQTHIILFSEDPSKNANIGQQIAHRRQAVNDAQLLLATYTTGLIEGKGLDPSLIIQIVDKEQGQPFGFLIKGPDLSLAENPSVPTGDTSPTIKRDSPDA